MVFFFFAFKQQDPISHSSGSWESKIRLPAWLGSGEDPLQVQTVVSVVSSPGRSGEKALWCLFDRALNLIHEGSTLIT